MVSGVQWSLHELSCFMWACFNMYISNLIDDGLDGLAISGNAPKIFLRTTKSGLPYVSIIFTSLFATLAFMATGAGSGKVFGWFANMTSIAGLMTWFGICFTYIRFYRGLKAQGYDRASLPFTSRFQPYAAWYAMIFILIVAFVSCMCYSWIQPNDLWFVVQWMDRLP